MKTKPAEIFLTISLACFGILAAAHAVIPPPDGGYPGFNTAEGHNALSSPDTSTGLANTAVGWFSLKSNVDTSFNTAVGAGTLFANTADQNTAVGAAALLLNTTGDSNTAVGVTALLAILPGRAMWPMARRCFFSIPAANLTRPPGSMRC